MGNRGARSGSKSTGLCIKWCIAPRFFSCSVVVGGGVGGGGGGGGGYGLGLVSGAELGPAESESRCCVDLDVDWKSERRVGQRGHGMDSPPDDAMVHEHSVRRATPVLSRAPCKKNPSRPPPPSALVVGLAPVSRRDLQAVRGSRSCSGGSSDAGRVREEGKRK